MLNSILVLLLKKVSIHLFIIFNIYYIKACIKLQQILRSHYDTLERATRGSLRDILLKLYSNNVITETVRESLSYSKMIQEFEANLPNSKDVSELKRHCQVFLECISQGGPTDAVAKALSTEWGKVFGTESLLTIPSSTMIPSTPSPVSTIAPTGRIIMITIFNFKIVHAQIVMIHRAQMISIQHHHHKVFVQVKIWCENNDQIKSQ